MSFNNFQQADARECNAMDAANHHKRLEKELKEIIRFFEEEDTGMMLYLINSKKLDVSSIKKFISATH